MADNKYQGITWDEPSKPVEKEPTGVTWDKPSVSQAMKQGVQEAFTPEAISELGKRIPPEAAGRMAAAARFGTGVARIPANLMKMVGVEEPSQFVKSVEEGAKNLTESAGYKGGLDSVANFGGEMVLGGAALKAASKFAPALEAIPGGAAMVKSIKESPASQAILGGMGLGAAGSSGSAYDVAKEAGLGGLFGLGGQAVASTLGHVAAPVLARYKELKGLGYSDAEILKDTTIGQLLGGNVQKLENLLSNIPLSGIPEAIQKGATSLKDTMATKIAPIFQRQKAAENVLGTSLGQFKTAEQRMLDEAKTEAQRKLGIGQTKQSTTLSDAELAAQRKLQAGQTGQSTALDDAKLAAQRKLETEQAAQAAALKSTQSDIHIPAVNYALKPLGIEIPGGVTGNEAMRIGQTAISDAYKNSLSSFSGLRLTKPVQDDLKSLTNTYDAGYLGKDGAELFKKDIERLIGETSKGKWLTPDNWQRSLSNLSKEAYQMRQKDPRYSKALYELKDKWMDVIEGQVGSDLFKAANTAFSKFKVPERAAAYASSIKAGGEFSPNELINALKAEMNTKRLAGGEDELQQLAVGAYNKMVGQREALTGAQSLEKQNIKDLFAGESRKLGDIQTGAKQNLADLFTSKGRALSDIQTKAKQNLADLYGKKGDVLEDNKNP